MCMVMILTPPRSHNQTYVSSPSPSHPDACIRSNEIRLQNERASATLADKMAEIDEQSEDVVVWRLICQVEFV